MGRSTSGWQVLERQPILTTPFVSFENWKVRHRTDPGETTRDFSMVLARDYIGVVARTEEGKVVLLVEDHVADGLDLQIVYGAIQRGETPEAAARRETGEEAGWRAHTLVSLGTHIPQNDRIVSATEGSDGAKTCYTFLALGVRPHRQRLEGSEKIRPVLVPWEQAVAAAYSGEVIPEVGLALTDTGSRLSLILADRFLGQPRS